MSNQPTLTRLLTLIAFAGCAVYIATIYQMLSESAQIRATVNVVAAIASAYAGWSIAGPRIEARLIPSFFGMVQGLVVAILLSLTVGATIDTFQLGYKTRYKDLGDATQGFFGYIASGVQGLAVPDILVPLGVFCVVGAAVLSVLFRMMEARRTAR